MEQEVIGMDEVMVVAYGTSKRSSFTGSAQKVGSEELVGRSTSESIDKMLSGKVSGVRVSSTTGSLRELQAKSRSVALAPSTHLLRLYMLSMASRWKQALMVIPAFPPIYCRRLTPKMWKA
jgi:hypothetical protein